MRFVTVDDDSDFNEEGEEEFETEELTEEEMRKILRQKGLKVLMMMLKKFLCL